MTLTVALAGDTMLGRGVADLLRRGRRRLFADEVVDATRDADLCVLNLECCVSERGRRWAAPGKPFFFRAPPSAVAELRRLGVDAVTLANNHALDYGPDALADTIGHLDEAGIASVGAGPDRRTARRLLRMDAGGARLGLLGLADHPEDFAAGPDRPGIAYADLRDGVPDWVTAAVRGAEADTTLVAPHWGPNMTAEPVPHVRAAADALLAAGATLVAGHSAHVCHGVAVRRGAAVLFDLGDFVDDYAVDPDLRNDLSMLWRVTVGPEGPRRVEALPLWLDFAFTRLAEGAEAEWLRRRFRDACAALGTPVRERGGWLVVDVPDGGAGAAAGTAR
ncbi:MAG: CapA family protein [Actinobacteria bacterium]|nr:CapA family protein [Actinomycetota bacterium]